jgi:hypothetical protein
MTASHSASTSTASLARLPDRDLLRALHELVARDREVEAELLAHLGEVEARALYLEEGCASMFAYCTEILHFSEAIAYHRIHSARAARAYPLLLERLRRGELHLSGVKLLAPHLTPENHVELLERARHQSKRAIEALLADRAPKLDAPSLVRRLPQSAPVAGAPLAPSDSGSSHQVADPSRAADVGTTALLAQTKAGVVDAARATNAAPIAPTKSGAVDLAPATDAGTTAPLRAAAIPAAPATRPPSPAPQPLGQERFKIQFTASRELCLKLREVQALLRHQIPSGDLAEIFGRALTLLFEDAKRKKFAQTSRPAPRKRSKRDPSAERKPASRHIPAEVKRTVAARDKGRCAFVAQSGRRCGSRDFLEFHHKEPWARSRRHSFEGIELRCRAHNYHAAVQDYGAAHMARYARKRPQGRATANSHRGEFDGGRAVEAEGPD